MGEDRQKRKLPKKSISGFWGTLSMTFLITVIFGLLIYGMYITNIISLIDFSSFIDNSKADKGNIGSIDNVYDALNEGESVKYTLLYDVTPEELTEILTGFTTPESYSFTAETVNFGTGKDRNLTIKGEVKAGDYLIEKTRDNTLFETVRLDKNTVTVTDNIRNRFAKYENDDSFTVESICGIPSLSMLTDICRSVLDSADNLQIIDYEISLVSSSAKTFYRVAFTYPDINQKDEYFVSSENGIIESAYTYINDRLVYRYTLSDYHAS